MPSDGIARRGRRTHAGGAVKTLSIEHPIGEMSCVLTLAADSAVASAALLRTARKLMDGIVFS